MSQSEKSNNEFDSFDSNKVKAHRSHSFTYKKNTKAQYISRLSQQKERPSHAQDMEEKTYPIFHVPSRWWCISSFRALIEFKYSTSSVTTIQKCFSDLECIEDNSALPRDYLRYMVEDILVCRQIPFMSKSEISTSPLVALFSVTPDMIVKGKKVIDYYSGSSSRSIDDKQSKYKEFKGLGFDFIVITPDKVADLQKTGLDNADVKYLQDNYRIFASEYQYWCLCLKLEKILFKDQLHYTIKAMEIPPDEREAFEVKRRQWCKTFTEYVHDQICKRDDKDL